MKKLTFLFVLCCCLAGCGAQEPEAPPAGETVPVISVTESETEPIEPSAPTKPQEEAVVQAFAEDALVPVLEMYPQLLVEIKYATEDNFTGQIVYDAWDVFLRYGTLEKLMEADRDLREQGFCLKLWDGFRPVSAQAKLWAHFPDGNFVSHPETGYRNHCRGNAVDITLCDSAGKELEMPSGFDDFSPLADWDFSDCSQTAAENAQLLRSTMEKHGFRAYQSEWWHFTDETEYSVAENFAPVPRNIVYAVCQEYITLRSYPSTDADSLLRIPAGAAMEVLAHDGDFSLVYYEGLLGYVLSEYTGSDPIETEPEIVEEIQLNKPWYYARCDEFINLREQPDLNAAIITQIPAGDTFQLLESHDKYGLVDYRGVIGYVVLEYIEPVT